MTAAAERPARNFHHAAGHALCVSALCLLALPAAGGGEASGKAAPSRQNPRAQELRDHYASRQAALSATYERTAELANWTAGRYARRTQVVVPTKDAYGDPIYARYGRRAYAGTPAYTGPAYVASFGTPPDVPYGVLSGRARLYWSGPYADPGYVPRTDVNLGVTTGQGYIQHGMQLTPGSLAPSYTRPAMLNSILD